MESRADQVRAFLAALALHLLALALIWWSARWIWPQSEQAAAGEPVHATLRVSQADLRRAQAAIRESAPKASPPAPQPRPAPRPQTSDVPPQPKPQAPQDRPDTVDQQAIVKTAPIKAEQPAPEQEARRRQEQVDLTEEIERQQQAERRQRLRAQQLAQLEAIQRERDQAAKQTRMEEQRLKQLADLTPSPAPQTPTPATPTPPTGERGVDEGLLARYKAALNATARANWNTALAPERVNCQVRFTQVQGGHVINVEFIQCPYDAQGRESVERALLRTPMPFAGFESVFQRQITLNLCHPEEACH